MRRWPRQFGAALIVVLGWQSPALSWSLEGHRIVGKIADLLLEQDTATRDKVRQLIGNAGLSEAAKWADCAKGYCNRDLSADEQVYVDNNPRHKVFHYTDVPYQQTEYRAKTAGTERDDVVQVIAHAYRVLKGPMPTGGPAVMDRPQAVWVLAHLVGDIHQPLHVGSIYFNSECDTIVDPNVAGANKPHFGIGQFIGHTTGGNDLTTGTKNLHSYWDSSAVNAAMNNVDKDTVEDYAQHIVANPPANWTTSGDPTTWSTQWATEVLPVARQALRRLELEDGEPGRDKDDLLKCKVPITRKKGYSAWAADEAHKQLAKAGFRLAAILREALKP